jgi:hypothetical protein
MTLPNTPDPSGQAVPAPPVNTGGGGGPLAGLKQWLIDSYNGLYKIVLEPSMPTRYSVALLVVGLIIGLIWGYAINPTTFSGANPNRLSDAAQEQWVKILAVGADGGSIYDAATAAVLLHRIPNAEQVIDRLLNDPNVPQHEKIALTNLRDSTANQAVERAEAVNPPGIIMSFLSGWLLPAILVIIIFPICVVVWRLLIFPNIVAGIIDQFKQATNSDYKAQKERERADRDRMREESKAREQLKKDSAASNLGPPIMTQLSIYSAGRSYDESYEIELESGEFLGQSGAVISEAVDPDPVAIEVWLFDMFSSKNIAKVFITPHGNSDPAIRSRIEASVDNPATDIIVAETNSDLVIESEKLRLQAKMSIVEFNANGRFENFRLQLLTWQKAAAGVGIPLPPLPAGVPPISTYDDIRFDPPPPPAGVPPISTYDDIRFDPPPPPAGVPPISAYDDIRFDPPPPPAGVPPISAYDDIQFDPPPTPPGPLGGQAPGSGSLRPLQPPPLNMPHPPKSDDDDPFGGTGDFTPLGD